MTPTEVPLRHRLLYRNPAVGSAHQLPADQWGRLWRNFGWSLQTGEPGPEVDRHCRTCGATWVGHANDPCDWCQRRHDGLLEGQRTLVMMEPDSVEVLDGSDNEIQNAIEAWATRLRVAVKAGLVTEREANQIIKAYVGKVELWRSEQ